LNDEQINNMQFVNRQKWDSAPNRVVLIERLHEYYRYTMADGSTLLLDMTWGIEHHPIALCGD
jgi:hypothetical protein